MLKGGISSSTPSSTGKKYCKNFSSRCATSASGAILVTRLFYELQQEPDGALGVAAIAAARLGAQVEAPRQYWRSAPRGVGDLFVGAKIGMR